MRSASWKTIFKGERGATMLEYALLTSLLAVVAMVAVATTGKEVKGTFTSVNNAMAATNDNPGGARNW